MTMFKKKFRKANLPIKCSINANKKDFLLHLRWSKHDPCFTEIESFGTVFDLIM